MPGTPGTLGKMPGSPDTLGKIPGTPGTLGTILHNPAYLGTLGKILVGSCQDLGKRSRPRITG